MTSSLISEIEASARQWAATRNPVAAFLSGSFIAGTAHAMSDVDVYVVVPDASGRDPLLIADGELVTMDAFDLDPPELPIVTLWREGRRWDVELWLQTQVEQLLHRLARLTTADGRLATDVYVNEQDLDFYYRLSIAHPVLGSDWIARQQALLRSTRLSDHLAARCFNEADGYLEDAAGMLQSGDLEAAVLAVRLAVQAAVDGRCAAVGSLQVSPKWRAHRVRTLAGANIDFGAYWGYEAGTTLAESGAEKWVSSAMSFAQDLIENTDLPS